MYIGLGYASNGN